MTVEGFISQAAKPLKLLSAALASGEAAADPAASLAQRTAELLRAHPHPLDTAVIVIGYIARAIASPSAAALVRYRTNARVCGRCLARPFPLSLTAVLDGFAGRGRPAHLLRRRPA